MPKIRITVLKKTFNKDLFAEYVGLKAGPCDLNTIGKVYISENGVKPEGFCDWAWNDLNKIVTTLCFGGTFRSQGYFQGWMKQEGMMIACCTDGIRPVIYKLERIED